MPKSGEGRYRVIEWLMWQMGGPGPMLGQVHHFVKYNKGKAPYAEERYLKEGQRLYKVLNTRLEGREFVADQYSIADIAIWPWISRFEWQTIDLKSRGATRCPRIWDLSRCRDPLRPTVWLGAESARDQVTTEVNFSPD
jgi:glutathione S-transferase